MIIKVTMFGRWVTVWTRSGGIDESLAANKEKFGCSKLDVKKLLKSEYGIDSRDFFYPMHKQPIMIKRGYIEKGTVMPVSEKLWENGLYLPSSTNLSEKEIYYIF